MPKVNTHQIRVETEADEVNVTIADHGGVAGGFAKFFNRVIDSGVWADLSDAARAAYMPLVRFADHRNHFRVRIGQAALMRHSGLSRSSVKRAMKDLIAHRLLVVVDQGGVTAQGQNECNLYQLLVPPAPAKNRTGPALPLSADEPTASSTLNPEGVPDRTPSRPRREPIEGPPPNPPPGGYRTDPWSAEPPIRGSAGGPQFKNTVPEDNFKTDPSVAPEADPAAVHLLVNNGVEPETSRTLAAQFPHQRIVDVVATMDFRRARGKCDNPGGFIRDALVKQWQVPRAVLDARHRATARQRQQAAEQRARDAEATVDARARDEETRLQRRLDLLDDDELSLLAAEVLRKYEGNPAVLQVLTRRPPRECRLMKMEIGALLDRPPQPQHYPDPTSQSSFHMEPPVQTHRHPHPEVQPHLHRQRAPEPQSDLHPSLRSHPDSALEPHLHSHRHRAPWPQPDPQPPAQSPSLSAPHPYPKPPLPHYSQPRSPLHPRSHRQPVPQPQSHPQPPADPHAHREPRPRRAPDPSCHPDSTTHPHPPSPPPPYSR